MWFVPNGLLSAFRVRNACRGSKIQISQAERRTYQYVLDCLKDNPPRIRNIKQYLLAALCAAAIERITMPRRSTTTCAARK